MSNIIREGDVDIEKMRARLTPQHLDDALESVDQAITYLLPLTRDRAEGEESHEVMRALSLVRNAIEEALEVDTPCCECGGTDAPLHPSGRCGHCGPAEDDK